MSEGTDDSRRAAPRATMAEVAALAGVSAATVSLALRNHPRISEDTRKKVREAVAVIGYKPDPRLTRLMAHLRNSRNASYQSVITGLTTVPPGVSRPYLEELVESARSRAEELGYGFSLERVPQDATGRRTLQRELHHRGIEGLLIFPLETPMRFDGLLDWSEVSVVSATYSLISPEFHRVVPHQFANMLRACQELGDLGYRRIGLVLERAHDVRVHHGFTAAIAWEGRYGETESVTPLLHEGGVPENVKEWFFREKPDVILCGGETDYRGIARALGLKVPGRVGFAVTSCHFSPEIAGIDEDPNSIGITAMNALHSKIQIGEKGIPDLPTVTMINGTWLERPTVLPRKRKKRASR